MHFPPTQMHKNQKNSARRHCFLLKECHPGVRSARRKSQWLFLSVERAVAPGHEVGGTKGAQSKDLPRIQIPSISMGIILFLTWFVIPSVVEGSLTTSEGRNNSKKILMSGQNDHGTELCSGPRTEGAVLSFQFTGNVENRPFRSLISFVFSLSSAQR